MGASGESITRSTLARFPALARLGPDALREIRLQGTVGELPAGRALFAAPDARHWAYFLLEGRVAVSDAEGRGGTIEAGGDAAREPLGGAAPATASARASTRVVYLRVARDLLEVLDTSRSGSGYEVEELHAEDERAESRLFFQIYQDYLEDRLDVPELPELGVRVRRAVEDPDIGVADVARIVQADPALVARLLRVANSPLYGGTAPARNIREAVVRLGLGVTRDLVTSFTLKNLFETEHRLLRQRILDLWRRSSMVAAVCYTIARKTRCCEPEQALLAGLIHGIGAAALLRQAALHADLLDDPLRLDALVESLRGQVGAMVLEKWGFPEDLVTVARESREWMRDANARPDLCDIVLVAQLHGYADDGELQGFPAPDEIPAYRKLGLGELTDQQKIRILDDAKQEIAEVRRLLTG